MEQKVCRHQFLICLFFKLWFYLIVFNQIVFCYNVIHPQKTLTSGLKLGIGYYECLLSPSYEYIIQKFLMDIFFLNDNLHSPFVGFSHIIFMT